MERSRAGRSHYTHAEDKDICYFVLEQLRNYNQYRVRPFGNEFWKRAEKTKVTQHSFQSMRDHFKRSLLHKIDRLVYLSEEDKIFMKDKLKPYLRNTAQKDRRQLRQDNAEVDISSSDREEDEGSSKSDNTADQRDGSENITGAASNGGSDVASGDGDDVGQARNISSDESSSGDGGSTVNNGQNNNPTSLAIPFQRATPINRDAVYSEILSMVRDGSLENVAEIKYFSAIIDKLCELSMVYDVAFNSILEIAKGEGSFLAVENILKKQRPEDLRRMEQRRADSLLCFEQEVGGRKSPDLWPESVPGVTDFTQKRLSPFPSKKLFNRYNVQLEHEDVRHMNELGQLSADQLMAHIKALQNTAYQLGIIEAKELSRGKFLKVLEQKQ